MKLKNLLLTVSAFMLYSAVSAQVVSKDSISSLKQQKEAIQISKKINDRKLELAKLQNSVEQKTREAQDASAEAQKSADLNSQTAAKLSTNADDKKLARDAKKSAKQAERDAKQARKATANLDDLQKDIESLKKKISEDEAKLAQITNSNPSAATPTIQN